MKVEKLDHIHLYVKDQNEVAKFFADLFETKWVGPVDQPQNGIKLVYDNLGIELIQPTSPDHALAKTVAKRGNMIGVIVLKVTDLDEAVAELESRGIRILVKGSNKSMRYALLDHRDTMGIGFELVEYQERLMMNLAMLGRLDNLPKPF